MADAFEQALRRAEDIGDWCDVISLYIDAAVGESAAFYLTHAYIHALEANDPRAPSLRARLEALGAEQADGIA